MNGPTLNSNHRYQESLKNMASPVLFSQLPKVKMDLRGLSRYAKKRGVSVAELTEGEKNQFGVFTIEMNGISDNQD